MDISITEFPFVASLPKRERTKLQQIWMTVQNVQEHGLLILPSHAAELLGISRQRVSELQEQGTLESVEFLGHRMISIKSVLARAETERLKGRPPKMTLSKQKR